MAVDNDVDDIVDDCVVETIDRIVFILSVILIVFWGKEVRAQQAAWWTGKNLITVVLQYSQSLERQRLRVGSSSHWLLASKNVHARSLYTCRHATAKRQIFAC